MSKRRKKTTVNIDNKTYRVDEDLTILQAAQLNDVYIPTLCAHKEMTPFGGCRMCIVEVEGMRGFPTACTTPVAKGMKVRTHTAQIQAERREILQLVLSEHTSSCLICDERHDCKKSMVTIRKAGVITGCRYCPNDDQCELQDLVEYLEVKEIGYPVYYRNLRVEKNDPFYDRDYNLCVLCGRCIRMCQEIRTANTLSFQQRGRYTVIGPAFGRTHLEAGCEFCGACVTACPTGALAEKARKWDGNADRDETTTCPLCGIGCQLRLEIKGQKILGSLPTVDPLIADGQLCVKGRFCITELVNNHRRVKQPEVIKYGHRVGISWEEAIDRAADALSSCSPERFGMLVSADSSNEDMYVAQKFTRIVMGSHNVDTSARAFYGPAFNVYLGLLKDGIAVSDLRQASTILCIGLDTRYERSVLGVVFRRAAEAGVRIVTIHPRWHSLSLTADLWIQPEHGEIVGFLRSLERSTRKETGAVSETMSKERETSRRSSRGGSAAALREAAVLLNRASSPVIVLGSEYLHHDKSLAILQAIEKIALNLGAGVLPLPAQANLAGSVLMGTYPELLPGGFSSRNKKRSSDLGEMWGADVPSAVSTWHSGKLSSGKKREVLYLCGEIPSLSRPRTDFMIFQNIYPPDPYFTADLVLPSAAFTEADGTLINGERRIQRVRRAVAPPGEALPDWEILCRIARRMGAEGFDYSHVGEIQTEIASFIDEFGDLDKDRRSVISFEFEEEMAVTRRRAPRKGSAEKEFPFVLDLSTNEHTYRGFPLSDWVEGARELFPAGILCMSPEDAQEVGLAQGDEVVVNSATFEQVWPVKIVSSLESGTLRAALHGGETFGHSRYAVSIRKKDV